MQSTIACPLGRGGGEGGGEAGAGGTLQQAPGGGFMSANGRAFRAPPKFSSSSSSSSGGSFFAGITAPDWLAGILQPPAAHAHVRLPTHAAAAEQHHAPGAADVPREGI